MRTTLEDFYKQIPNTEGLSTGKLLPYLIYFLEENKQTVSVINLKNCFLELKMKPYSNISAWLSKNSKGKQAILIRDNMAYRLERNIYVQIKESICNEIIEIPSEQLLPKNLVTNAPFYIDKNINEMLLCYDKGLYSACLVMMRKLLETLIIECFEKYGIENEIKDNNGDFFLFK